VTDWVEFRQIRGYVYGNILVCADTVGCNYTHLTRWLFTSNACTRALCPSTLTGMPSYMQRPWSAFWMRNLEEVGEQEKGRSE